MAEVRSITNPVINKISLGEYNNKVAAGVIDETMIADQVWIDQDLTVPVQHKLLGIEEGAEVNTIETIKVNGVEVAPVNKVVDINIDSVDVPTKTSDLINDSGFITGYTESDPTVPAWAKASTKPSYSYNEITDKPTLFSGSYNDLTDKPAIPSITGLASTSYVDTKVADLVNSAPTTLDTLGEVATAIQNNASVVEALNSAIGSKANASSLSTVATSGSYNDLTDKPTLSTCTLKIWG